MKLHYLILKQSNLQSIRFVQKRNKLALNPFDDKRIFLTEEQSLQGDKHIQSEYCLCIYCIKFVMLYQKELTESKTCEETCMNVWYIKERLNQY